MGKQKISSFLLTLVVLAALASACNLLGAPESTPTVNPTDEIATIQAIAEQATNPVSGSTALPPTVQTAIALIPTRTPTPFPSSTPFPTVTSTPTTIPTAVLPATSPPTAVPPPTANFLENVATGFAPLTVQFTNLSSGVISTINWNFGDGTTGTEFSPTHTYNIPGLFNVTLTVGGPGGTSSITRQISVQSPPAPVAAFVPSVTGGAAPLGVQFTNHSTGVISGMVWNFGDGTTSTERNPTHTFSAPGLYNVRLTVTGPGGTSSATSAITVQTQSPAVQPPVAAFTQSVTSNQSGLTVNFTNLSTGVINSYNWNFGDGTTSADLNPVHVYTVPGQYVVTLTVNGPGGQRAAQTQITYSIPPTVPPTATFLPTATATPIPPTATLTWTPSLVPPTATLTETPTPLPTDFPTLTPTWTETPTETPLPTDVPTDTPTETPLPTLTETPTEVPTDIPTETPTETPLPTLTETPTELPTLTETPTELPTLTETPTELPTLTETPTETPLPTDVPTETPTETPLPTETPTDIPTDVPTETPTEIPTDVPTETPTEAPTDVPSGPVDTAPVIPDISGGVLSTLSAIFNDGAARGHRPSVMAFAGDETAANLAAFATPGNYFLDDSTSGLQGIIDWYTQTPIEGGVSLNRTGIAVGNGWTAQGLILPFPADSGLCLAGETPLSCEFRLTQPAAIIISVGMNDAIVGTDVNNTYRGYLEQAIQIARDNGVMPILMTLPPRTDGAVSAEQLRPYNEVILEVAAAAQVPVINIWRALNALPDQGNSVSPSGPGDLTQAAISTYGVNARNWALLTTLNDLRAAVFPNAAP